MSFVLEPLGVSEYRPCECCDEISLHIWGLARDDAGFRASYFVHWTYANVCASGATFDFILFGSDGETDDPKAVTLSYRNNETDQGFMVIDADGRPHTRGAIRTRPMKRVEVIGQPIANIVFALCDAIMLKDPRVEELTAKPAESAESSNEKTHH